MALFITTSGTSAIAAVSVDHAQSWSYYSTGVAAGHVYDALGLGGSSGERLVTLCHHASDFTVAIYSDDNGHTWPGMDNYPATSLGGPWGIAHGPRWCVAGDNTIFSCESNALAWTQRKDFSIAWRACAWTGTRFVLVGNGGWKAWSTNGLWDGTPYYTPNPSATWNYWPSMPANFNPRALVYCGSSKVVAVGHNDNRCYVSSDDGETWAAGGNLPQTAYWTGLVCAGSVICAAGHTAGPNTLRIATSSDQGTSWTERTNAASSDGSKVLLAWDGTKIACTSSATAVSVADADGVTWSAGTSLTSYIWDSSLGSSSLSAAPPWLPVILSRRSTR